ncbi:uncharacterized protein N7487_006318, partial [Penicillium crustosum]|uniref:uncharacterized protein n=1 Tax=Penicillium crustosum TaxID=36656 RepID=UPI0023876284
LNWRGFLTYYPTSFGIGFIATSLIPTALKELELVKIGVSAITSLSASPIYLNNINTYYIRSLIRIKSATKSARESYESFYLRVVSI